MVECYLKTSSLYYTILRSGGLLNLPATGNHQRIQLPQLGLVTRQDIAIELSNIAENKLTYQQTYTVIDPNLGFNMKLTINKIPVIKKCYREFISLSKFY